MFGKKLNDFFSLENRNFKRERKEKLRGQIQIEEYRSELM